MVEGCKKQMLVPKLGILILPHSLTNKTEYFNEYSITTCLEGFNNTNVAYEGRGKGGEVSGMLFHPEDISSLTVNS